MAEMGGAQVHVLGLLRHLSRVGLEPPGLLTGEEGFLTAEARKLNAPVFVEPSLVHPIRPRKDIEAVLAFRRVIRDFAPDIVHTHSSKAGLVGRLASRLAGVPAIFTAHGWGFTPGVPWARRTIARASERFAAPLSARIITVSDADRNLAATHGVGEEHSLVTVHNGMPDVPHVADPGSESPELRVAMTARFSQQKDHLLLLRTIAGLRTPWRLSLIGDGPLRPAAELEAARLGIADRVEFLGDRRDVPELLATAHVFVLTSNWEGLPISIIEAMRAGLPVISSDVGGVNELVEDGKTGFLVPRGDAAALLDRLGALAKDRRLRASMGSAGRTRYLSSFSEEQMLEKIIGLYRGVHAAHVPTPALGAG